MKINWTLTDENGETRYVARLGSIHARFWVCQKTHTCRYEIFFKHGGKRRIILQVFDNPIHQPKTIDARLRCEYILVCLDNNLRFNLLPIEKEGRGSVWSPDKIPPTPKFFREIEGISIGRVYRHYKGGLYRIIMIGNAGLNNPDWPVTIGYRDIITGQEYCRARSEFTSDKYTLVPINEVIDTGLTFIRVKKETENV